MNLLDLVLVFAMAGAATTGFRLGLAARALSWLGAMVGLVASVPLVPFVLARVPDTSASLRLLLGLGVALVAISLASSLAGALGLRLRRRVHATAFGPLDRVAGGVAGAGSLLLAVWFLLPAAASTPGAVARAVRSSTVVSWVESTAPTPPDMSRGLARLIDRSGFPEVFADLGRAPETGPPPSQIPVDAEVVAAATASTVNVETAGCGSGFEGSGFVVEPGVVVTNAHVVAGAEQVWLRRPDGDVVPADILHTDPARDLALLGADLDAPPLELRAPQVGEPAATIGYPGGQNVPRVAPATVSDDRDTVGRDVYGDSVVDRRVLYLSAQLRRGDSGSPLIGRDGAVLGVVFAVSPDNPTTAYALHTDELMAALSAPPNNTTGPCL
jgi:S1-C subfamily serine protease